jgi:hypothetical protein
MTGLGHAIEPIDVEVGEYEGPVNSAAGLADELTESMWLSGDRVSVSMPSAGHGPNLLVLVGPGYIAPLVVAYHGGTIQERETLRAMVERRLPEPGRNPVRSWRWLGPLVGLLWAGTLVLLGTRISPIAHAHIVLWLRIVIFVAVQICDILWATLVVRLALGYWFPALERLPDSGQTRWDAARTWVVFGLGTWLAIALALLALPERNPY